MNDSPGRFVRLLRLTAGLVLLAAWTTSGVAATVKSVGTVDLATQAGFIFHGKVIEKWVAAGSREGSIYTYMRFQVTDVLKGKPGGETVVLSFLGGTLKGRTLRVEGMKLPGVGDEGVYFVSQLGRNYVQPFYGWDQGRFQVQTDGLGRKTVFTHDAQPVKRVDTVRAEFGLAGPHAKGVVVSGDAREALSLDQFKAQIRGIVEAQQ